MLIFSNHPDVEKQLFPGLAFQTTSGTPVTLSPSLQSLVKELFPHSRYNFANFQKETFWQAAFFVENSHQSQYELVKKGLQQGLYQGVNFYAHAGSGQRFQGFKGRSWIALPGNIHLTILLSPERTITNPSIGFLVISTLAILRTLNRLEGLERQPSIRWVNDLVIDNIKISGVLSHTVTMGQTISSALLGIGLNVEKIPEIKPDPYTPEAGCLNQFSRNPYRWCQILPLLLNEVKILYQQLLKGEIAALVKEYRRHSFLIGRKVEIHEDKPDRKVIIARGRVTHIGDNLELYLEGHAEPITRGRPVLVE